MSAGDTIASLAAAPGLLVNRAYKLRVTTAAQDSFGFPLAATFTHALGFTTTTPNTCDGSIVISEVYSKGGFAPDYASDFIELHNRGTTSVSLEGMSVQYATETGQTYTAVPLTGTVAAGGYYLIGLASFPGNGFPLPTPDLTANFGLNSSGKIALVNGTVPLTTGCPEDAAVDFLPYGAFAICSQFEGAGPTDTTPGHSTTRLNGGCSDVNITTRDFTSLLNASPQNTASPSLVCTCEASNESGASIEADYCTVQSPLSATFPAGSGTTWFGRLQEAGITEAAGQNTNVVAQFGVGPRTTNPEYDSGWRWTVAKYNAQAGSADEYFMSTGSQILPGTYGYAFRFTRDQGQHWTYCDANQGDTGAGSNPGLTFEHADVPVLTVTP
jgi:hypothetical protein